MITLNWYYFILIIIFVIALTLLLQKSIRKSLKLIKNRALFIKQYWQFSIFFVCLAIAAYIGIFYFFSGDNLSTAISVLNAALTIIFAIFVGYYAFMQVAEIRVNRNREEADRYLNEQNYFRAALKYEELFRMNPNDYHCLSNLLEIKLIDSQDEFFQMNIDELQKTVVEPSENITCYFLKIAKELFLQRIGDAKTQIKLLTQYVSKNPEALSNHRWSYSDVSRSKRFQELAGETKDIFETLIKYLQNRLNEKEKEAFENNDYALTEYKKIIEEEKKKQEDQTKPG